MTKDEVTKLRMNSPESLQFLNNATKFYNLMMMYRCAIRNIINLRKKWKGICSQVPFIVLKYRQGCI